MLIPLNLDRERPLQQQLFDQLRDLIVSGRLAAGSRMPSSRMLADEFAVSRITVLLTYERMIADGLLETLPARGTFVRGQPRPVPVLAGSQGRRTCRTLDELDVDQPDPAEFPTRRWRALVRESLDRLGATLAMERTDGHPDLRRAIAGWLSASRGLNVSPDQVVLAACRQQALYLAVHLLLLPGQTAVVEDPCHRAIDYILTSAAARLVRVPVDDDGIRLTELPREGAALVHVTPEHQQPLGMLMSVPRREALLNWTKRTGSMILEEDCDGELRYGRMDLPPLMASDRDQRVVHVGSFAASLGPGVSSGYLVVPANRIDAALSVRRLIDGHAGWLEESALAELLGSGAYARHLHQLRKTYLSRRDALIRSLQHHFGGAGGFTGIQAGLHLIWHYPPVLGSAAKVAALARQAGLRATPSPVSASGAGASGIQVGFGMPGVRQIEAAVAHLAACLCPAEQDTLAAN